MSTDLPSSDPRASLVRAIGSVARNGDIETILAGILAAATDALGPSMGAIFIQDPDRPGIHLAAVTGMDEASTASPGCGRGRSRPPVHRGRHDA